VNPLFEPLAAGFRWAVALRHAAYRRGWFKTRRLSRPVISVGNLTMGGTGKTPLVAHVARILLRRGWHPSILSRGYGRQSKADLVAIAPGFDRHADPLEVGDEPALLARLLPEIPLVVCADRFRGGKVAEERFPVDVHILDDGFQHWQLERSLDIVVLDATSSISDRQIFPAGRQREPLSALRRAPMVVITRASADGREPLEALIQEVHPAAKVFHSSTQLVAVVDTGKGEAVPFEKVRAEKVTAFCGIGNPAAFFADVRRWQFNLIAEDAFSDHHVYTEQELERLVTRAGRTGAAALLTTEKDAVKLPRNWQPELPILTCVIETPIEEGEDFEATLLSYLGSPGKADG
jgi:tetraacyldisaccharide 4'-kinase